MLLTDSVQTLPLISHKYAPLLANLGILTVQDLLTHFPRAHRDSSQITAISDITLEGEYTIQAFAKSFKSVRLRGNRSLQRAVLQDNTGNLTATWFNQPYLAKVLNADQEFLFKGKLKLKGTKAEFYPNLYEPMLEEREVVHLGRVSPEYPLTAGISSKWLRNRIKYLIDHLEGIAEIGVLDSKLAKLLDGFSSLVQLLQHVHFPDDLEQIEAARHLLGVLELAALQLSYRLAQLKAKPKTSLRIEFNQELVAKLIGSLPFKLTGDQQQAIADILLDLRKQQPMNRLLQGDVGSGKTVVAAAAAVAAASAGKQTVILAPTTILAGQHFRTFSQLLLKADIKVTVELVTAEQKQSSSADILIGTSAVLARKLDLITNLGLVIVDEQHRFGVGQREDLLAPLKPPVSQYPHLLNMTATPIPRTMALALFGELELSLIAQKPLGRLPINTKLVPEAKRASALDWLGQQLQSGQQVYWVCPRIEDNPDSELASAKTLFKQLQQQYPDTPIGLLHGRLAAQEKEQVMQQFHSSQLKLLVSTSVIEVGVDVPGATIVVIEAAERFGLAQLHQIRGRVGRNDQQSWCLLFQSSDVADSASERLQYFATHQDGLEIAEYDLSQRGPGEVYGKIQSGIPDLKVANLANLSQVQQSRELTDKLLSLKIRAIPLFSK